MHVVHIITSLEQGGAEAMLEKLLVSARAHDPLVTQEVVSLRDVGVVGARLRAGGVSVRALDLAASAQSLLRLTRLIRYLRSLEKPVVVQTWLWHGDLVGGLAARLAGLRAVVWNVRNTVPAGNTVPKLCALLSRFVPASIVCNAQAAERAHRAIGYQPKKFVLIPNGFDLAVFKKDAYARANVREAWAVADDEILVGLVARADPLKDHPTFLRAAALVSQATPKARFVLVGDGIRESVAIKALIQELSLQGKVVLAPRTEHVPAVMSALDVFCLTSIAEGFPNVLGEAMACALPCVTTDVGDARSIVGDDQWVVPPGNAEQLAQRLAALLSLPTATRDNIGAQMRKRVDELFSVEAVWMQYRRLYESVLKS